MEFYLQEETLFKKWNSALRPHCILCDFTSVYSVGNCVMKGNLSMAAWAQNKETKDTYLAKMYHFPTETPHEDDYQANIEKQVVLNEIKALRAIEHPNIMKLAEVHELNGVIVLVMEFISGSSLLKHILSKGSLPENEVVYIMETLLKSLRALHSLNIVHRNLKPENILLDYTPNGTELKITEFGFSCVVDPNEKSAWEASRNVCGKCGTPGYMAPEVLLSKQSTTATDIFSMGVVFYTCLTGEAMFKGRTVEDIIHKNLEGNFNRLSMKWNALSKNARDIILKMTSKDPLKRPSIDTILEHPFFTENPKLDIPTTSRFHMSPLITVDSERLRQGTEETIGDSMSRGIPDSERSMSGVLQSLILPPSYSGLTKNGGLEVPEFYIKTKETLKTLKELTNKDAFDEEDSQELLRLFKTSLKFETIRGSLGNLDQECKTPRFNLKSRKVIIAETLGMDALEFEDEDISDELDKNGSDGFIRQYTFPRIHDSPFRSQTLSPMIEGGFETQVEIEEARQLLGFMTTRKLPEVATPMRKTLTNKFKLLEDMNGDFVPSTREF